MTLRDTTSQTAAARVAEKATIRSMAIAASALCLLGFAPQALANANLRDSAKEPAEKMRDAGPQGFKPQESKPQESKSQDPAKAIPEAFRDLVHKHAAANNLPPALVHRVIMRESRYDPRASAHGNYGIMQIRLGTAKAMGYTGNVEGLFDADTNMTYAVRYLAGAYRTAGGNADRAMRYYASGYYYEAKRQGFSPYHPHAGSKTATADAASPEAASKAETASPSETTEIPALETPAPRITTAREDSIH